MTIELNLLKSLTSAISAKRASIQASRDAEVAFDDAAGADRDAYTAAYYSPFPALPDAIAVRLANLHTAHEAERKAIQTLEAAFATASAYVTTK